MINSFIGKLIFNKYTLIIILISVFIGYLYLQNTKIENLQDNLKTEKLNNVKLIDNLESLKVLNEKKEKELKDQINNILKIEKEKEILNINLQKKIDKRNDKDIQNILNKKEKLTEITLNNFIKNKIEKYNNGE